MNQLQSILKGIQKHEDVLKRLLDKVEFIASESKDQKLIQFIHKEREKTQETLTSLKEASSDIYPSFQKELQKRTQRLEIKIERLNKTRDALVSDNYLLEYKKKDLLILANKLEEANEEISQKNEELIAQQKLIQEQAERLNAINEELEKQKEDLMDQSDYLHEANQTITRMHQEVEKQKDEILQKNQELLNLNNEKNNLIGIVAHDLKSPLNQIRGLVTLMKTTVPDIPYEAAEYIEMIEHTSERLSEMIGKILDVEAIESKTLNLEMERLEVSKVVSSLVDQYKHAADEKEIALQCFVQPAFVFADAGYLLQVLENLLSNAIKFSPRQKSIYITVTTDGKSTRCEIRDEGPGLTEEDKKKVFKKYQKLSAKPTGNETSTGLGLSIVKRFVEAMNGTIGCESQAGEGAKFFVCFPCGDES